MSKRNKSRGNRKQGKRSDRIHQGATRHLPPRQRRMACRDVINRSDDLIIRGKWAEAREELEACDEASPGHPEVMRLLLEVYHRLRDYGPYCRVGRRLLDKEPHNPELHLMLASGYLATGRAVSALLAFRCFLDRWPNSPLADGAHKSLATLTPVVDEILRDVPFPEGEKLELAAIHEEMTGCLSASEQHRVIELGERLLARVPQFVPAMNNMSQAYFLMGRAEKATSMARRVLELDPENFHALANLARFLLLDGRKEEAEAVCSRLRAAQSEKLDIWTKKAEAFSLFGDDQAVLDAFDQAKLAGCLKYKNPDIALLYHFAAVAHARQGRLAKAKPLWRHALATCPGHELANGNLADTKRPPAKRHGPWPFCINYWVRRDIIESFCAALDGATRKEDDELLARAARRFVEKHPELTVLVPMLLDRGDDAGRQFACQIARLAETPELLEALRVFCLSDRGPDDLRIEMANYLGLKDVLPAGLARLWIDGKWREFELCGFEITDEPTSRAYPPVVEEWASEAMQAIRDGDGKRAEMLLRRCLEAEGDRPDLLNNLAAALELQDRIEEADRLLREILERWPDYFFGRLVAARKAARAGDHEAAERYLAPLRQRRRFHRTEFVAMCMAHFDLFLAQGKSDVARSWLDMWKGVDPEHPEIERCEWVLAQSRRVPSLPKWLRGRR
jgi:tetratricopeptide (TPR) repeat protein